MRSADRARNNDPSLSERAARAPGYSKSVGIAWDVLRLREGREVCETPVRCTATAVELRACCSSARCVLRGFVSETE
eukprot:2346256-Pleurochrysis_carterae.AAC.4